MQLGIAGVGRMGVHMALRLLRGGRTSIQMRTRAMRIR